MHDASEYGHCTMNTATSLAMVFSDLDCQRFLHVETIPRFGLKIFRAGTIGAQQVGDADEVRRHET